ncbi:GspE/PulE family protein [Variovorax sp. H27-G14]|uniref:GspE/PulE family protein n=1 Tax=Variovorax sp. H27-G14 TaxID=3111914 RepID=UPI0038FC950A
MNARTQFQTFDDYLINAGILSPAARQQVQTLSSGRPESLLGLLRRTGMVPEDQLVGALARYTGWPMLSGAELMPLDGAIRDGLEQLALNVQWSRRNGVAIWIDDGQLVCATADVPARSLTETLNLKARENRLGVSMRLARVADLENVLGQIDHEPQRAAVHAGDIAHLRELAEEGPIVELVNSLLSQALTRRASDLHIEPGEYQFEVRVRVDGVMRELQRLPLDRFDATVCRIKILSQLDIAERRLPQDGRMTARIHGESFDIRVSVLPGVRGESVVMRLLRQDRQTYQLSDLGMIEDHAEMFRRWTGEPNGIVLVTGPTGSGKTTTLYTALDLGNDGLKKIITIEDPVEYKLAGITQLQVNADIGYNFAAALRSILRHDPDVILIGEIRDRETAAIAVQSALTGHLVFSTLHTNSGAGAVSRLVDMGVEPFLLASSLRGIMAQRLVRRLCPHCSRPVGLAELQQSALLESEMKTLSQMHGGADFGAPALKEAVGCDACLHTGYLGRIAVYELFDVTEEIREGILSGTSESSLIASLRARGIRSMAQDGYLKVWRGISTVAEVLAVG